MSLTGGTLENGAAEIERIIALNITAAARLAIAAGRAFRARGKGGIVHIALVLALAPEMFEGVYNSEEHKSELQSPMSLSYSAFCLKKKKISQQHTNTINK